MNTTPVSQKRSLSGAAPVGNSGLGGPLREIGGPVRSVQSLASSRALRFSVRRKGAWLCSPAARALSVSAWERRYSAYCRELQTLRSVTERGPMAGPQSRAVLEGETLIAEILDIFAE